MKSLLKFRLKDKLIYFAGLLVLLQICSCKCDDPADPECRNYDPCYSVGIPYADFGAGYKYSSPGGDRYNNFYPDTTVYLDGDTIPRTCTFYAYTMNADSFYWKVGQDARIFRGNAFYLEFGDEFILQPINVELITLKESDCFEKGFSRDSIQKTLVVSNKQFDSPSTLYFNSKYYGVSTEFLNDSFEINFKGDIGWIENLPRGTNGNTTLFRRDYDEVHFTGQYSNVIWLGHAKFQPENRRKIVIRYKVSYDFGETSHWYTYEGWRLD